MCVAVMQGGVACVVILGNVPDISTSSLYIYICPCVDISFDRPGGACLWLGSVSKCAG